MSETSQGFPGFPEGKTRLTPIPSAFFTELLPAVDDLAELKVTLYAFWALARSDREPAFLRRAEMLEDERLLTALRQPGLSAAESLDRALERAVQRGVLLQARIKVGGEQEEILLFLNSAKGRQAAEGLRTGGWHPEKAGKAARLDVERPTIYTLYEQNIGPLTPMIAERLQEAERSYPSRWIEEAIGIAVENNARKWRYVEAILEDWNTKGRHERKDRGDSEASRRRYIEGEFADHIEH